jgi:hypothetical protein
MAMVCAGTLACTETATAARQLPKRLTTDQQVTTMKISIDVGDTVITASLDESETTRDFVSLLPLSLTLTDYAATERISDLPRRLSTKGAPPGSDPAVGDIAYYAPWGNLAIFYRDADYANGLIRLGRIDANVEALRRAGQLTVKIELVGR